MNKNILLIDGNYFARRVLGQINMNASVNNLLTDAECEEFFNAMTVSLCNLYQTFNNEKFRLIDNIIFVRDNNSFRKKVPAIRPYYLDKNELIGYKEQREEDREKSSIDYDNFYETYNEWCQEISGNIPLISIEGLEGDDLLMLVSRKLFEKNIYSTIFCTDGDLKQLVNEHVFLFRNIRSKDVPNGEFVLSPLTYRIIFEKDIKQTLIQTSETKYWNQLFNIMIGCIDGTKQINRELNKGLSIAEPIKVAFEKIICGDKKDNIFSIFGWKASTGTRIYKVTELMLEKTFKELGKEFDNQSCQEIFNDKNKLIEFLLVLKDSIIKKIPEINIIKNGCLEHLKHNLKMIILNPNMIPEEYKKEFEERWKVLKDRIIEKTENYDDFVKKNLTENSGSNYTTSIYTNALNI
jgi:hypothetical protein